MFCTRTSARSLIYVYNYTIKSMSEAAFRPRKRNRLTIVCRRCRLKKSKCDRQLPCNNCCKAKCPELCEYERRDSTTGLASHSRSPELAPRSTNIDLQQSIEKQLKSLLTANVNHSNFPFSPAHTIPKALPHVVLEGNDYLVGINPVVRSTDKVNFHMDFYNLKDIQDKFTLKSFRGIKNPTRSLPFVVLSQQEPGAKLFWRFGEAVKDMNMKLITIQSFPADFQARTVEAVKQIYGPRYIPDQLQVELAQAARKILTRYGVAHGISFTEGYHELQSVTESFRKVMPAKNVVLAHFSRFFAKIYPICPIIDEEWLHTQFERIVRYSASGNVIESTEITSREDLAVLALILLILRLSYLSMFSNIVSHNEDKIRIDGLLILTPITVSATDVARALLLECKSRRSNSFVALQASILMCVYLSLALDSETPAYNVDSDYSGGLMIQMAISLNLDRDPDNYWDTALSERTKCLRRKVWYYLVHLDYSMGYLFFSPRVISPNQYDTKLPKHTKQNSNIVDTALEEEVVALIGFIHNAYSAGSDLLDICLDLRNLHSAADILGKLTDFELYVSEHLGSVDDYFHGPERTQFAAIKILHLRTQVMLKIFVATLHYFFHLYYKYNGQTTLDFFFLRKVLLVVYTEMNYFCSELMFDFDKYFDDSFPFLITPIIMVYLNVVAMVGLGLAIRLNCSIIVLEVSGETSHPSLSSLKQILTKNEMFVLRKLKVVKLLGERYFYAWKCTKSYSYGYTMVNHKQLYHTNIEALQKASVSWSERQLYELLSIIPEDVHSLFANVGDVRDLCYYSNRSVIDRDFRGMDLFKTVQTDNLWVNYNALVDRDPYICDGLLNSYDYKQKSPKELTPAVNGNQATNLGQQYGQAPHPIAFDASQSDAFDFNLLSTDWSIDDFLPVYLGNSF